MILLCPHICMLPIITHYLSFKYCKDPYNTKTIEILPVCNLPKYLAK